MLSAAQIVKVIDGERQIKEYQSEPQKNRKGDKDWGKRDGSGRCKGGRDMHTVVGRQRHTPASSTTQVWPSASAHADEIDIVGTQKQLVDGRKVEGSWWSYRQMNSNVHK